MGIPSRSKAVGAVTEAGLEDRFEDQPDRRLHHAIPHSGDAERTPLGRSPRLGYVNPPHRLWTVAPFHQQVAKFRQHLLLTDGDDRLDGLAVDASGAPVASDPLPGLAQDVGLSYPVVESMEPPCVRLLRGHVKRMLECAGFVGGVVGLGHALTRLSQDGHHRSAGPSLRRVLLSRRSSVLWPAPTPSALSRTSVWPYTGTSFRGDRHDAGYGRASPVDRSAFPACRRLYAGAVPRCSRDQASDCCLHPKHPGSARSFLTGDICDAAAFT